MHPANKNCLSPVSWQKLADLDLLSCIAWKFPIFVFCFQTRYSYVAQVGSCQDVCPHEASHELLTIFCYSIPSTVIMSKCPHAQLFLCIYSEILAYLVMAALSWTWSFYIMGSTGIFSLSGSRSHTCYAHPQPWSCIPAHSIAILFSEIQNVSADSAPGWISQPCTWCLHCLLFP